MPKRTIARALTLVIECLVLATCKAPFGPRDGIVDPGGTWVVQAGGVSPADGATTNDTTPLLDWGDVTGAASYEVQIADTAAGLDAGSPVAASASEYQVPLASAFAYGVQVFWRARAVNGDGVGGPWTAAFQFTVEWTVDYGTISPADGATTNDTTPTLDWGDVAGAVGCEVQIATGTTAVEAATPVAASGSQYQMPLASAFAYGDQVSWRVRAVNADGVGAAWSANWSFDVFRGTGYVYVASTAEPSGKVNPVLPRPCTA